jgi:spoIIIJ-associated protein
MSDSQQRGIEWLEQFLKLAGVPSSVEASLDSAHSEESCWLTIDSTDLEPEQTEALIGSNGEVLDAIQYLANTTLNLGRSEAEQQPYTVELGEYRVRRQAELQAIAEQAAQEARETSNEVEIPALSAAERRQVHTLLKAYDDLETYSRGKEPDRRLVVRVSQQTEVS